MLACARIGAVHSVVFGGFSPDSLAGRIQDCDSKLVITADEGLRGGKRIPLKANVDAALNAGARASSACWWSAAPAPRCRCSRGRDFVYEAEAAKVSDRLRARADGRGGPAVHPLHLGLDGEAEGRAAHHRRLPGLGRLDPRAGVRLPPRRGLLVHRRRRLGHRPQLHRLRPARERRDHADVRGRAQLPDRQPLLGGDRQAPGGDLLHRAHRHPRPDARGRRAGDAHLARVAAPARHRRRADQPGGLALVPPRGRRGPLPDRRHLVADRDRRRPDLAAARRARR